MDLASACHGGNDADLITGLERRFRPVATADVGAVDEDINEAANAAVVFTDSLFDAGMGSFKVLDQVADRATGSGDLGLSVREATQRSRDENGDRAGISH